MTTNARYIQVVMRLMLSFCIVIAFLGFDLPQPVQAADQIVTNTNDSGAGSLRQAVSDASYGSTITFDPSLAGSTITLSSLINFSAKDITIDGSGLDPHVTISGNNTTQIFQISGNAVILSHLDLINGSGTIGGAIYTDAPSLTINNILFENNTSTYGGAISHWGGDLFINDSIFNNNNSTFVGGAIAVFDDTIVNRSTFTGNSATDYGGGLYLNTQNLIINNSTIFDNDADAGGGIFNDMGILTINNSTISENEASAGEGAGISDNVSATLHLTNSIISDSTQGFDCLYSGTISTNTNNLIEDGSCSPLYSGDPGLGPLADNGGTTKTMAITESSLALDKGNGTSCESMDQRGITRPQGDQCDIGAFELKEQEIDVLGNGQSISSGDSTPSSTDHTVFGTAFLGLTPVTRIFTIQNEGEHTLSLTGSPEVEISGVHASDFTVTSQPSSTIAPSGGTSTFTVSFSPGAAGLREATITIANNDSDENPYTFSIQGTGSDGTFSDVTSAHWAFLYVEAIADAGLTSGYPDGTYRPENRVTRAEMAVFLLNGMGISAPPINGSHPFTDIAGHWAEAYIEELFDQGITGGYPDGTYRPENLVTRAEMAVFLLKGIGVTPPALDGSHPFTDVAGHWAEIFIEELFDQGITGGYPDGTYRPENRVTRAEMAVFLVNTFNIPLP